MTGKIIRRVRAIGPHPVVFARYAAHHVGSRAKATWLRRSYDRTIAAPRRRGELRTPAVGLVPAAQLPPELTPAAERLRDEAESILAHEVEYLGSGPTSLGERIDWHRDFKSGHRWPESFYLDAVVTRLTDDSDAKVPWELSRGHQLLTLARAARLWEDERFASELERQLESWLEDNPAGRGINWTNPMEVAIRAVNWIWAIAILEELRPLRPDLRERATRSLQSHGRHIRANLEGSPWLRSNHYLADVLGLLVLGAFIDDDSAARRWLQAGRRAFEREITTQVHPDGLAFEASLPYHGLVLEMFLLARHVAAAAGQPLSAAYDARLRSMLEATRAVRHPDGRLPQTGDADSGRILPAGWSRPPTADHLLWLGAAELGHEAPLGGHPHEEVAWTFGVDAWTAVATRSRAPSPVQRSFPDGGVYVLDGGGLHVVVRCGDVGQNGNGGHAHNDALSFELSAGGKPFVLDPGTYVYTSDPDARNLFRGTAAHSTVTVAGEEIHPVAPDRLFELAQFAHPSVERLERTPEATVLVASHDGYRRLEPPVEHRRTFALDALSGSLTIEDELSGTGTQRAEAVLQLAPGAAVARTGEHGFAVTHGGTTLTIAFVGVGAVEEDTGWVSNSFGTREPAPRLRARVEGALPLRFGCRIHL